MKKILLVSLSIITSTLLFAQASTNDQLKQLINKAFEYFPRIKEAENMIITSQEKLSIAQINQPVADATLSYNFVQPKITIPFNINGDTKQVQFFPVHNVSANVSASYMLLDFGRIKAAVDKAKTDLQYARHNVDYAQGQLANQVAVIYYNIIYLQKAIAIEDTVLNYLNESKRITESKLKNGDAIKIDLLNIQASVDAEENRKVDIQNSLQKQINLLAYTTGQTYWQGQNFDFEVAVKDALSILSESQTNNMEFVLAKDKTAQAKSEAELIKAGNKPSVGVGANAGFKNGFVPNVAEIRFNYAAGISLKIPLYDGGKTKRQLKLNETIVQQNELALKTLDNNFAKDIQQTLTDINSNMERIQNTKGQIEQTRAAWALANTRLKEGVGTNLEITNASTNVQRAAFTRLQYEYQLCLAKLELARLSGYKYW